MKHNTELSDHELLKVAANAVDYRIISIQNNKLNVTKDGKKNFHWNPLEDDRDAFRLAVELKLSIIQDLTEDITSVYWSDIQCVNQAHRSDAYAATRRAIVRGVVAKYVQENK